VAIRPCHGIEDEAQVKVKSISHVAFAVDSNRKAENLKMCQRDADEASLKLNFGDHIV
jgi:hypothetical protein